jgi:hypothetical protein
MKITSDGRTIAITWGGKTEQVKMVSIGPGAPGAKPTKKWIKPRPSKSNTPKKDIPRGIPEPPEPICDPGVMAYVIVTPNGRITTMNSKTDLSDLRRTLAREQALPRSSQLSSHFKLRIFKSARSLSTKAQYLDVFVDSTSGESVDISEALLTRANRVPMVIRIWSKSHRNS